MTGNYPVTLWFQRCPVPFLSACNFYSFYVGKYNRTPCVPQLRDRIANDYIWNIPCLWVPVTTAWCVLRLRMEERPPIWRVAANKLNNQSRTADKGWSSSLGVGRGANNSSPWETKCYEILIGEMLPLETKQSGGKTLPHSDLRRGGGGGF